MSTLSELIDAGKQHRLTFTNKDGKPLLELSLLWAVIIAVAAPQALLLVIVLALLDLIRVKFDGKPIDRSQYE
jgi:hypothetical protein